MEREFVKLDSDGQRAVDAEFLSSSDFGSFQITDFRKNSWASRMVLAQAIKFWMGRKAPLPLMGDVSKTFGIENFEIYRAETRQIGDGLQKKA